MYPLLTRITPPLIADRLGWTAKRAAAQPAAPPSTSNTVGMTSPTERAYYSQAVRETIDMEGAIVDLGCWLGSTSISLAKGLPADNPTKIHAFDRFIWYPWMDCFMPMVSCDYLPGESFLPEARRRMKSADARIEIEKADLTSYEWTGGPIKLLLVDAMKDGKLTQSIARSFYPSLIPGSILLHQDFKHYNTSWIHILQYRLREFFKPRQNVKASGTMSFETVVVPSNEQIGVSINFDTIPDDEAEAAFAYSMSLIDSPEKASVAAAHIMHYRHMNKGDRARELLATYLSTYDAAQIDLKEARESVERMPK